jgi:HAD superfamily hydrolase (TIGR01509 family)
VSEVSLSQRPRAVLWDVDGTLVDSAEYHWLTWREVLSREGYDLKRNQFRASFGQRNDEILQHYFGPDLPVTEIERIGAAKEGLYRELIRARGIKPLPGVRRWVEKLKADRWRQAIASSAPLLNVDTILDALGFEKYFEAIAAAEDVERGKPDPQIFLVAASKLDVPTTRCIVVEDAPAGVEAARRASMCSIGVLTSQAALEADLTVHTLAELSDDAFDRLLVPKSRPS